MHNGQIGAYLAPDVHFNLGQLGCVAVSLCEHALLKDADTIAS